MGSLGDRAASRARIPSEPRVVAVLAKLHTSTGHALVLLGAAVLAGWAFDVGALKSVAPGLATMKANCALGLALAGVSLRWSRPAVRGGRGRVAAACAWALVALALVTLTEYALGWDAGIGELLVADP